jgi:hypothetical protein
MVCSFSIMFVPVYSTRRDEQKLDPTCICFKEFCSSHKLCVLTYNIQFIHKSYETQLMYKKLLNIKDPINL